MPSCELPYQKVHHSSSNLLTSELVAREVKGYRKFEAVLLDDGRILRIYRFRQMVNGKLHVDLIVNWNCKDETPVLRCFDIIKIRKLP